MNSLSSLRSLRSLGSLRSLKSLLQVKRPAYIVGWQCFHRILDGIGQVAEEVDAGKQLQLIDVDNIISQ